MTKFTSHKHLLIVEDSPSQIDLITEALASEDKSYKLHIVQTGEAALDFLYRRYHYAKAPRPNVILLDLNLPKVNGLETLAIVKEDPNLKTIPIIVFSTSSSPADILSSYRLQANCYVKKPNDIDQFFEILSMIDCFWLKVAELPQY